MKTLSFVMGSMLLTLLMSQGLQVMGASLCQHHFLKVSLEGLTRSLLLNERPVHARKRVLYCANEEKRLTWQRSKKKFNSYDTQGSDHLKLKLHKSWMSEDW